MSDIVERLKSTVLPYCLKPEEINGAPDVREARVDELIRWFERYNEGNANPKWVAGHANELVFEAARLRLSLDKAKAQRDKELAYSERSGMERAARIARTHGAGALAEEIEISAAALFARRVLAELEAGEIAAMSKAMNDVVAERRRQVEVEGWTPGHDDQHDDGQLAAAAAGYALHGAGVNDWIIRHDGDGNTVSVPRRWPWDTRWWKPKNPRRDLVRAAALIIAEIERLDRLEAGGQDDAGTI